MIAITFVIAVLLAGSDGPYFPWINILGILPFAVVALRRGD